MIIDCKTLSLQIKDRVRLAVEAMDRKPCLAVIQVGDNPASSTYVRNKERACEYCGIRSLAIHMPTEVSEEELLAEVARLNEDSDVDGLLVQLPLPSHIDEKKVANSILPSKDVDGFHYENVARLWQNEKCIVPCTPKGIIEILEYTGTDFVGKNALVIGRSNIVGKPAAKLLLDKGCSVTICHSKTPREELLRNALAADIIVVAVGKAGFFDFEPVKKVTVIDVGINRNEEGKLVGDCSLNLRAKAESSDLISLTPVPGGVGLLTVACLMQNVLR